MKARMPFESRRGAHAERQFAVWLQQLLCCYTLHTHFGFGRERLLRFLRRGSDDAERLGHMQHGYAANRTWADELWAWGEEMGLNDVLRGGGAE